MSNEAAKLISDAVLGYDFKTILIGEKGYSIYPPTIKIICRAVAEWSQLNFDFTDMRKISTIGQIPECCKPMLRGLSYFVVGDVRHHRWKAYRLYRKWMYGTPGITPDEMNEAVQTAFELIQAQAFFDCATTCASVAKMVAKPQS